MHKAKKIHIPILSRHAKHKKSVLKTLPAKKIMIEPISIMSDIWAQINIAASSVLAGAVSTGIAATAVSEKGKLFIKSWEQGPKGSGQPALKIYDDADMKYKDELRSLAGRPKGFWTIGYGHLLVAGDKYDTGISISDGEKLFDDDLKRKSVDIIKKYVTVSLNQRQLDALASYVFNTGSLNGTRLLANINKSDFKAAAKEMDITTSNGKVLRGLVTRRTNEQNILLNGIYENHK